MAYNKEQAEADLVTAINRYERAYFLFKKQDCDMGCRVAWGMAIKAQERLVELRSGEEVI